MSLSNYEFMYTCMTASFHICIHERIDSCIYVHKFQSWPHVDLTPHHFLNALGSNDAKIHSKYASEVGSVLVPKRNLMLTAKLIVGKQ